VDPQGLEDRAVRVERGTGDVRIVVPLDSSLVLEVPSCPEWIAGGAYPTLAAEGSETVQTSIRRKDGTFLFTGLVPGLTYDAWFRLPEKKLCGYAGGLTAGGRAVLDLSEGVSLTGRCTGKGVTSYEDLELTLRVRGRKVRAEGRLDGTFTIPCLPPVEGILDAEIFGSIPDDLYLKGSATVLPGREAEIRLRPER
jgi:hypothetical protein